MDTIREMIQSLNLDGRNAQCLQPLSISAETTGMGIKPRATDQPLDAEQLENISVRQAKHLDAVRILLQHFGARFQPIELVSRQWMAFAQPSGEENGRAQSQALLTRMSSIIRYCRSEPKNMLSASVGEQIMGSPRRLSEVLSTTPFPVSFSSSTMRS